MAGNNYGVAEVITHFDSFGFGNSSASLDKDASAADRMALESASTFHMND